MAVRLARRLRTAGTSTPAGAFGIGDNVMLVQWRRRVAYAVVNAAVLAAFIATPAGSARAAAGGSALSPGDQLTAGQSLVSTSGAYQVIMQGDGNLVEYFQGRALWSSGTQGHPGAFIAMQGDGNLVVYGSSGVLWTTGTQGHPGAWMQVQDDANLVVYSSASVALWVDGAVNDRLTAGQRLTSGQYLQSPDRAYMLAMQGDGNLVEYVSGQPLWMTATNGHSGVFAVMQTDGNFVVYDSIGTPLWNAGTQGHPGAFLALQSDANLVVYTGGTAIWANYAGAGPRHGDDVSSHQGTVDWGAVAAAGAAFAYAKATEGTGYVNPFLHGQYNGAKGAGLYAGAYHFGLPDVSDGRTQADFFLDHAEYVADGHTLPPALDIEYNPYGATCYGLSAGAMVAWVRAFVTEVKARTRHDAVIYTTTNWWNNCTGGDGSFGANPLWISHFSSSPTPLPPGWSTYAVWQYANSGPLPGDQDLSNGSLAGLTER
jgi:GH25 family lysozyme M1 (1,4-beta-N-acetylmuramidase)